MKNTTETNALDATEQAKLLEAREEALAKREEELAALEKKLAEQEEKLAARENQSEEKNVISEQTLRAKAAEAKRKAAKEDVTLDIDPDPNSRNTFACSVNGVSFLVPKGKTVKVPVYVADLIREQKAAKSEAAIALIKASGAKQIGEY